MCKVYTGYRGTSEIEHGLCACTVDNPLAKARGLSLRTGAQIMLYHLTEYLLPNTILYDKVISYFALEMYNSTLKQKADDKINVCKIKKKSSTLIYHIESTKTKQC